VGGAGLRAPDTQRPTHRVRVAPWAVAGSPREAGELFAINYRRRSTSEESSSATPAGTE
jgi:hypothetical protein